MAEAGAVARIVGSAAALTLSGCPHGFVPLLAADLARANTHGVLLVAPDEAAMRAIADAAPLFAPELEVLAFPSWDCLPYDRASPSLAAASERMAALARLQRAPQGPRLVLATAAAALQRTLTPFRMRGLSRSLEAGASIERAQLEALLHALGYVRTDTVADSGEFAVRGSLIDLFPPGLEHALRLDFFGDEIESIRAFDPASQRSAGEVARFDLFPASEFLLDEAGIARFRGRYRERFGATATGDALYQAISQGRRLAGMEHWLPLIEEKLSTLFDHLPTGMTVLAESGVAQAAAARLEGIADYFANRERQQAADPGSYRPLPPGQLYLSAEEWAAACASHAVHRLSPFSEPESEGTIDLGVGAARDFSAERGRGENVYRALAGHAKTAGGLIFAAYSNGSRDRLAGLLGEEGGAVSLAASWNEAQAQAARGGIALLVLALDHGFTAPALRVVTEQDLLGDRLVRRQRRKKSADAFLNELATLTPGDLIVHREHGIGRYEGLTAVPVGGAPHDCVLAVYAGGDKLYVPVENLDVLSRYGSNAEGVMLDRLGGVAWQTRKSRMKERIREIAHELIATAAARALREADAMLPAPEGYGAFVERFPYAETEDQDRAIAEVVEDLASGKPMDRLVCGDVGFGKTEVALRAAYVAAMAGHQVALICPTTLLARQHFETFVERFRGFPLKAGRLSRLVGAGEAARTREGLAEGDLDIVIGTHALLAKSVSFKRLGLVIVDEEQRFGVVHKERLKALKTDVHVLTLTATPIPRTLQMAMAGLRDLSIIQTPPVDRLTVKTFVSPWDPVAMREALMREHFRGGQSFIVVPRIADLPEIEEFLKQHAPELSPVTAHGQMAASEVEERIGAFYDKRHEVLVSTSIVESGLDIPSANTMIIFRADRFGLAQLYQLRGRVGRSKTRAFCYLTTPDDRILTETAEKRLKILSDIDSLGAGFQLASHDLDLRGAGNLLGDEQSGHIREVGFELYQSMLEEAILDARAGGLKQASTRDLSPQITVDAPVSIPDNYVPDLDLRMSLYRRLSELETRGEIEGFAAEMIDRFGKLPPPAANLLTLIEIKANARRAHVAKIDAGPRGALVSFWNDSFPNVDGLLAYVARLKDGAKLRPDMRLSIVRPWPDAKARLNGILQLSRGIAKVAEAQN